MYIDPYERFLHKPVERKPPPVPVVPYARVKRHAPLADPFKRKPGQRAGRETWSRIAEIYTAAPARSLAEIARKVGMDHTSVYYALTKMGLYVKRDNPEHVQKRLYFRGIPGHVSMRKRQKERCAALITAGKHWHHAAKLDAEQVRAMRHMAADGVPVAHIARKFHVHPRTAGKAINGQHWKHVR